MEETHPEAAAVLRDAGWKPHDVWGVFTRGTLVMGSPRVGEFRIKNIAHSPDGPDTPDDPVAAALWLVAHEPVAVENEPEESSAHEAHEETGADDFSASADSSDAEPASEAGGEKVSSDPSDEDSGGFGNGPDDFGDEPESGSISLGLEILDADFTEPTDLLVEGSDFAEVAIEPDAPSGAFIFGDNLAQMRTAAIGLVVQISLSKQEAIWAQAGAGPDEYSQLMSAVVRDTVDGTYRGDQATYDRFVALSTYDNAARRVQVIERERVNMLTTADRATIEGFDPQAGWP